jgi:hypothetical protein
MVSNTHPLVHYRAPMVQLSLTDFRTFVSVCLMCQYVFLPFYGSASLFSNTPLEEFASPGHAYGNIQHRWDAKRTLSVLSVQMRLLLVDSRPVQTDCICPFELVQWPRLDAHQNTVAAGKVWIYHKMDVHILNEDVVYSGHHLQRPPCCLQLVHNH